jgi:hypothetical protein
LRVEGPGFRVQGLGFRVEGGTRAAVREGVERVHNLVKGGLGLDDDELARGVRQARRVDLLRS